MPLGTTPFEITVPTSGWRADLPIHRLPPDALMCAPGFICTYNVLSDFDGLLKPRLGYQVIHDFGATHRVVGGISWKDNQGFIQIVAATYDGAGHWWTYQNGTWQEIFGPGGITAGGANLNFLPTRFAVFGVDAASGKDVLYGTNGIDICHKWIVSGPPGAFSDVYVTSDQAIPGTLPVIARDLAVVENRLVFANMTEGPNLYSQRLRWTSVLGINTSDPGATLPSFGPFPLLSYNDLGDGESGGITALRSSSRTTAIAYTQNGPPYLLSGQYGSTDASAFAFDKIMDGQSGPVSTTALTNVGGRHFFVADNQHVYSSDGSTVQLISAPIDAFLASSDGLVKGPNQRPVTLWDKIHQRVWFFVAMYSSVYGSPDTLVNHALCLDLRRGAWEHPQEFPDEVTAAFPMLEQFGPTWDNPGIHAETTLRFFIDDAATTIIVVDGSGLEAVGQVRIQDEYISYASVAFVGGQWLLNGCIRGANDTAPVAHGTGTTVTQYYSWNSYPDPWDKITSDEEPILVIGTSNGLLCRFFASNTDRTQFNGGRAIPWSATWALLNPGPLNTLQVNGIDVLINPKANPAGAVAADIPPGDTFTLMLEGLSTPYDTNTITIIKQDGHSDDTRTWFMQPIRSQVGRGANAIANYLRLSLSGSASHNSPWFAGAYLYEYVEQRKDPVKY